MKTLSEIRAEKAKAFTELAAAINCKLSQPDHTEQYAFGIHHGFTNGFDSGVAAASGRVEELEKALNTLKLFHRSGADGERAISCCNGKHFDETLMAGDELYRVSYVDATRLNEALSACKKDEK